MIPERSKSRSLISQLYFFWLRSVFKQDLGKVEVRWVSSLLYEVALNLGGREIQKYSQYIQIT